MKIAVIGAVMDHPTESQHRFNEVLSAYKHIIKGRMGFHLKMKTYPSLP